MYEKSSFCIKKGIEIKWILHPNIFRNFSLSGNILKAGSKRRLLILDVISILLEENKNGEVVFYYNNFKKKQKKNELYKLTKTGFGFGDYYELKAHKYQ